MDESGTQKVHEIARKAKEWVASDEGKEQIQELLRLTTEANARMAEARRIEPKRLHEPMTL